MLGKMVSQLNTIVITYFNSSSTIEVYCRPISLAYKPGQQTVNSTIVGHCTALNVFFTMRVSGYRRILQTWHAEWKMDGYFTS